MQKGPAEHSCSPRTFHGLCVSVENPVEKCCSLGPESQTPWSNLKFLSSALVVNPYLLAPLFLFLPHHLDVQIKIFHIHKKS